MKIGHIERFVNDASASRNFYESVLGFEVAAVQSLDQVWVRCGEMEILLRKGNPINTSRYETSNNGTVLFTDDLESTSQELTKRGLTFKGTVDTEKCLTFTDPDGHWFKLVNPNDL